MEDEDKQKKVEIGRQKFAALLKKRNASTSNPSGEQKKKKKKAEESQCVGLSESDVCPTAIVEHIQLDDLEEINNDCASIPPWDQLHDNASVSVTSTNSTIKNLHIRVNELEDILKGKDAALEAALLELKLYDNSNKCFETFSEKEASYKAQIEECHKKIVEFQYACQQRDEIVQRLSASLKDALSSRDAVQLEGEKLANEVASLNRQLQATSEFIQSYQLNTGINPQDYIMLQNEKLILEDNRKEKDLLVEELKILAKKKQDNFERLQHDLEKKIQDLSNDRVKSTQEIQKLMREVEELHQQKSTMTNQLASIENDHSVKMAALQAQMEETFGLQLTQMKEELRIQHEHEREALFAKLSESTNNLATQSELLDFNKQEVCVLREHLEDERMMNSVLKQRVSSYEELIEPLCHVLENNFHCDSLHENQLLEWKTFYENKLGILANQVKCLSLNSVNEHNTENNKESVSENAKFFLLELDRTAKVIEGFINNLIVSENLHKDQLLVLEQLPAIKEQSLLSEDKISENKEVYPAKSQLVNIYKKLAPRLKTLDVLKNDFYTLLNSTSELTKEIVVLVEPQETNEIQYVTSDNINSHNQLSGNESVHNNVLNACSINNQDKLSLSSKLYMTSSNTVQLEKDICWVSEIDSTCDKELSPQANYKQNTDLHQNITQCSPQKVNQEESTKEIENKLQMLAITGTTSSPIPASLTHNSTNCDYKREINFTHEELIVEYLKVQSLLAGKEEIEIALENHIKDLEKTLSETKQKLMHVSMDNSQLLKLRDNLYTIHRYLENEGLKLEHVSGDSLDLYGKTKHIDTGAGNNKHSNLIESESSVDNRELLSSYLQIQLMLLGENVKKPFPIYIQELESFLNNESKNVNKDSTNMISKNLFDQEITEKSGDLVHENILLKEDIAKRTQVMESQRKQIVQLKNDVDKLNKELVNNREPDFIDKTGSVINRSDNIDLCMQSERFDGVIDSTLCELLEKCSTLNKSNNLLANRCEDLNAKVSELEMKNKMLNDELLNCGDSFNTEVGRIEENNTFGMNCEIEDLKLIMLEKENAHLKLSEENLRINLISKLETGDGMLNCVDEQNYANCTKQLHFDELILEVSNKSKVILILREKLKCQENIQNNLNSKINFQEELIMEMKQKVSSLNNELNDIHSKFKETCKAYHEKVIELNSSQKEIKTLKLEKEQLELCKLRLLECNDVHNSAMQQQTKKIINDFANEIICLQKELQREKKRISFESDCVQEMDVNAINNDFDINKFEVILKSNEELLAEKELLLGKLQKQQQLVEQIQEIKGTKDAESLSSELHVHHKDLMSQLSVYREQHASLTELLGTSGILQETVYRQKKELKEKLQEKEELQKILESEQCALKNAQIKLKLLEQQILEKDAMEQELKLQKQKLECDLREIEDLLRDQEEKFQSHKITQEAKIRSCNLEIQHWKLQSKMQNVNSSCGGIEILNSAVNDVPEIKWRIMEKEKLDALRQQLDEVHAQAILRLKSHLEEKFISQQAIDQQNFLSQLVSIEEAHGNQISKLQGELKNKDEVLRTFVSKERMSQLNNPEIYDQLQIQGITKLQNDITSQLEEIKLNLTEKESDLYNTLEKNFQMFYENAIYLALNTIMNQQQMTLKQYIQNLKESHKQELVVLQDKLEKKQGINAHAGEKELYCGPNEQIEIVAKSQDLYNTSVKSIDWNWEISTDEAFKQLKHIMFSQYLAYVKKLVLAWKKSYLAEVEKLSLEIENEFMKEESLFSSPENSKQATTELLSLQNNLEMLIESENRLFVAAREVETEMIHRCSKCLEEMEYIVNNKFSSIVNEIKTLHKCSEDGETIAKLEKQVSILEMDKEQLIDKHRKETDHLKQENDAEVKKLQDLVAGVKCGDNAAMEDLRQELEAKYTKEVEELRKYFEQKVAEVEKHYSEEIVSQHSRKLSGSSCGSDSELVSDIYYMGADHGPRLSTHTCDSYLADPNFKDSGEHSQVDFEKRFGDYQDKLETVKSEMEMKYSLEMEKLREEYETKVEILVKDLRKSHQNEITNLETKHAKEIQNNNTKWQEELLKLKMEHDTEISTYSKQHNDFCNQLKSKHAEELEKLTKNFEEKLNQEILKVTSTITQKEAEKLSVIVSELEEKHKNELKVKEERFRANLVEEISKISSEAALDKAKTEEGQKVIYAQTIEKFNMDREALITQYDLKFKMLESEYQLEKEQIINTIENTYAPRIKALEEEINILKHVDDDLKKNQGTHGTESTKAPVIEHAEEPFEKLSHQCMEIEKSELQTVENDQAGEKHLAEDSETVLKCEIEELVGKMIKVQEETIAQLQKDLMLKALLASDDDSPRPKELVRLQEKFAARYEEELLKAKEKYDHEIAMLKAEYKRDLESMILKNKNNKLEKLSLDNVKESSQTGKCDRMCEHIHADLEQAITERDNLRKMGETLRQLVKELVKYFTDCENELNDTLVEEITRQRLTSVSPDSILSQMLDVVDDNSQRQEVPGSRLMEDSLPLSENSLELNEVASDQCDDFEKGKQNGNMSLVVATPNRNKKVDKRRVHFAPDISSIRSFTEDDSLIYCMDNNKDLSLELRTELNNCLGRLKEEAAALLSLSSAVPKSLTDAKVKTNSLEEKISYLAQELSGEVNTKNELILKIKNLEKVNSELQKSKDDLLLQLKRVNNKVNDLEKVEPMREIITEGFGENTYSNFSKEVENMVHLQEQARLIINEHGTENIPHLNLLEALCREGDRLTEEARKEREDLQQQVIAADKQLRSTRQFLEEQAIEREQERDEFVQEIQKLQDQLRDREKDRIDNERLMKEIEAWEAQLRDANMLHKDDVIKQEETESELKAAVEKIWVLRDIITELECQADLRAKREVDLEQQVSNLKDLLEQQSQTHQQLAEELEALRIESGNLELTQHINHLEEQLQKHRLHVEQFQTNSNALVQMRAQLRELELALDKKTKDLESLYITLSNASCSSPSEDVSVREDVDLLRCDTPDEIHISEPAVLPLEELNRIQDKLQRHSRAEEVALKRIRDLEMQLRTAKHNEEEIAAERDILHEKVEQQLVKISTLESQKDEHRRTVKSLQRQASIELQCKIHDLEQEMKCLREVIEMKNAEISDLKNVLQNMKKAITTQEAEWLEKFSYEHKLAQELQNELQQLITEKEELKATLADVADSQCVPIPVLINSVLQEKNAEIDQLNRQIARLQRESNEDYGKLSTCSSELNLSKMTDKSKGFEMDEMRACQEPSVINHSVMVKPVHSETQTDESFWNMSNISAVNLNSKIDVDLHPINEISVAGTLPDPSPVPQVQGFFNNSTTANIDKEVEPLSEDYKFHQTLEQTKESEKTLQNDFENLKKELNEKNNHINKCESQLSTLKDEVKILQYELKSSIETATNDKTKLIEEVQALKENEFRLKCETANIKLSLDEKQSELHYIKGIILSKDEIIQQLEEDNKTTFAVIQTMKSKINDTSDVSKLTSELQEEKLYSKTLSQDLNKLREDHKRVVNEYNLLKNELEKQDATSLDDLTCKVEKELNLSAELDSSLLEKLEPLGDTCKCSDPTFVNVLTKILQFGLQALSLEELSYLHQLAAHCGASNLNDQTAVRMSMSTLNITFPLTQKSNSSIQQNGNVTNEHSLQMKVQQLESAVQFEKQCVSELHANLEQERNTNLEREKKINDLLRLQADLEVEVENLKRQSAYQEERLQQFIIIAEKERAKLRDMENDLRKETNNVKHLQALLEAERQRARETNKKDSELIEMMRIKLENALDNEMKLQIQIDQAKCSQESLRLQLMSHRTQNEGMTSQENMSNLKVKCDQLHERCISLEIALQQERRKMEELQIVLTEENSTLKQKLDTERTKVHHMNTEMLHLQTLKEAIEKQLSCARDQVNMQHLELDSLNRKVKSYQEDEACRRGRQAAIQDEADRARRALEKAHVQKLELERRVESLERRLAERGSENDELARLQHEHSELLHKLSLGRAREAELEKRLKSEGMVPQPVLHKLKNVNYALEQHVKDNSELVRRLSQLLEERHQMQTQIKDLEAQIGKLQLRSQKSETELRNLSVKLSAERNAWGQERAALQLALAQVRAEADGPPRSGSADGDADQRVKHLFGSYLRAESYRKSLIWQKRYLLIVLGNYEANESATIRSLASLAGTSSSMYQRNRRVRVRNRFKIAAIVIIVICRMQYLVRRWRYGRLIGGNTVLGRAYSESIISSASYQGPRRWGSTHSSQGFGLTRNQGVQSPPSRDVPISNNWTGDPVNHQNRMPHVFVSPAQRSSHLSEYVDRFDQIQQRLGIFSPHPPH